MTVLAPWLGSIGDWSKSWNSAHSASDRRLHSRRPLHGRQSGHRGRCAKLPALRGMVLVGPAPPGPLALPPEMREQQSHAYDSEESVRWTVENVLAEAHNLSEADMQLVAEDSLAGNQWAREAWPRYGMAEDVSMGLQGRGLRVEVLVGRRDRVESVERVEMEVVDVLREKGFEVDLTVEEDYGHLMPLEKPEAMARAVQKLMAGW